MKKTIIILGMLIFGLTIFGVANAIPVTSNPLWINTGISVIASDILTFTNPTAQWTWGNFIGTLHPPIYPPGVGPGGDDVSTPAITALFNDEWIQNYKHGEMIGFIGNLGLGVSLNDIARPILQNDARLFELDVPVTLSNKSGILWVGFNDDYGSDNIGDNQGTGSVDLTIETQETAPIPEPATMLLLGSGLIGLAGFARRRFKK